LLLALDNDQFKLLKIVSRAVKDMSEGELLQIEKARRLDIKESIYFEIIRQKTASLIAAACSAGVATTTQDEAVIDQARLFGEHIGMAFQIKDDLFDFGDDDIGKPLGIDIQEKKLTLPIIYALDNCSKSEKNRIINTIKRHHRDKARVREVIEFVKQSGGLEYARDKMEGYKSKALELLKSFPENESKDSLGLLIRFVTERKK